MFTGKLQTWGNSYGVRIPKRQARRLGLSLNQTVAIETAVTIPDDGFGMCKNLPTFVRNKEDREW